MVAGDEPVVQRRRLRVELRRLRQEAQLTQRDVAREMDWSTSKLIRIESGDVGISSNDLKALLAYYGFKDKRRIDALVDMAKAARRESWIDFRDVHSSDFLDFLGFESSARIIRNYEIMLVPGLLQTEEYARSLHEAAAFADREASEGEQSSMRAERRWLCRQRRQELHERDNPPKMFFILDEAVIRRRVGGSRIMGRQLERLKEWSALPHITIQILPFEVGAHPGMRGPFMLLDFLAPSDPELLHLEDPASFATSLRDDPEETGTYTDLFFRLEDQALSPRETAALLDEAAHETAESPAAPVEAESEQHPLNEVSPA